MSWPDSPSTLAAVGRRRATLAMAGARCRNTAGVVLSQGGLPLPHKASVTPKIRLTPRTEKGVEGRVCRRDPGFGRHFVPAVGAAVGFFKPFLDAMIAKDMLAFGQPEWGLIDALGCLDAKLIVADHAG